jgi:hypothetical protein
MVTTLDRKTRKTRYRNIMKDIQHPTSIHHHQQFSFKNHYSWPTIVYFTIVNQLLFISSTIVYHLTLHPLPQVPRCATPYVPLLWCGPPARQLHRRPPFVVVFFYQCIGMPGILNDFDGILIYINGKWWDMNGKIVGYFYTQQLFLGLVPKNGGLNPQNSMGIPGS